MEYFSAIIFFLFFLFRIATKLLRHFLLHPCHRFCFYLTWLLSKEQIWKQRVHKMPKRGGKRKAKTSEVDSDVPTLYFSWPWFFTLVMGMHYNLLVGIVSLTFFEHGYALFGDDTCLHSWFFIACFHWFLTSRTLPSHILICKGFWSSVSLLTSHFTGPSLYPYVSYLELIGDISYLSW